MRALRKVERAEQHIEELHAALERFRRENPYGTTSEYDSARTHVVIRITETPSVPDSIQLIIGDALNNLRSALEHVICEMLMARDLGCKGCTFPITQNRKAFDQAVSDGKVNGISAEAIAAIERLQPYNTGDDLLFALHHLNNIDKHRLLVTVGIDPRICLNHVNLGDMTFVPLASDGITPTVFSAMRGWHFPLNKGDKLMFDLDDLEPENEFQLTFEVAFNEPGVPRPEVIKGVPVLGLLVKMAQYVRNVISELSPYLIHCRTLLI